MRIPHTPTLERELREHQVFIRDMHCYRAAAGYEYNYLLHHSAFTTPEAAKSAFREFAKREYECGDVTFWRDRNNRDGDFVARFWAGY